MATKARIDDKHVADLGEADVGYDEWTRAKIERGLAQSQDRAAMIPVEQVLRYLMLER